MRAALPPAPRPRPRPLASPPARPPPHPPWSATRSAEAPPLAPQPRQPPQNLRAMVRGSEGGQGLENVRNPSEGQPRGGVWRDPGSGVGLVWSEAGSAYPQHCHVGPWHPPLPPPPPPSPAQSPGPGRQPRATPKLHSRLGCAPVRLWGHSGPCPHVLQAWPPKSRPHREPDTHSQIWVERTVGGAATRISPAPWQESGVGGEPGFCKLKMAQRSESLGRPTGLT